MKIMKLCRLGWSVLLIGTSVLSVAGLPGISFLAVARSAEAPTTNRKIQFVPAQPKLPARGAPSSQNGTGSRGDCLAPTGDQGLMRLVGAAPLDLTTRDRPTIWVYMPYTRQDVPEGEFALKWQKQELYRQTIPLPEKPGIVGIQLPETVDPLALNQTYRWYVDVLCNAESADSAPASLTGLIKRIEPTPELLQDLAGAESRLETVAVYAKHHVWYETLQELAQLRLEQMASPSLQAIWQALLIDPNVGLEAVAQKPIVGYLSNR